MSVDFIIDWLIRQFIVEILFGWEGGSLEILAAFHQRVWVCALFEKQFNVRSSGNFLVEFLGVIGDMALASFRITFTSLSSDERVNPRLSMKRILRSGLMKSSSSCPRKDKSAAGLRDRHKYFSLDLAMTSTFFITPSFFAFLHFLELFGVGGFAPSMSYQGSPTDC
jgi:hypothetical protein